MQYAKIKDGIVIEFPTYPQRDNPQTSFGDDWTGGTIDGITYVQVEIENTQPTDYFTQDTLAQTPTLINGKWIQKMIVVDISAAEKAKRKAEQETQESERNTRFLTPDEIKAIRKLLKAQA